MPRAKSLRRAVWMRLWEVASASKFKLLGDVPYRILPELGALVSHRMIARVPVTVTGTGGRTTTGTLDTTELSLSIVPGSKVVDFVSEETVICETVN